ncbi:endonuclease/exonuclease/phosphatase family protein [Corticibacterium sp. UT-5YL-CI-8]|nr:endonuclease/exonuclease/phosphatase family protein [Tianweitania sp. UT-5YL-CI-8]
MRLLRNLCFLAMMLASLPLVAGFFGALHPAFDSFAHFRIHLAAVMILCALPLLLSALRTEALMALVFGVATLATVRDDFTFSGTFPAEDISSQPVYRLMQLNLRYDNTAVQEVMELIERVQPDVITLQEVSAAWRASLGPLSEVYPYNLICPAPHGVFGVAIFSRQAFTEGAEKRCLDYGRMAVASFDFAGRSADVVSLHLDWPWPADQSSEIDGLVPVLSALGETALLGGDFNATPWSAAVHRVAVAGGLTMMPSPGSTWLYRALPHVIDRLGLPIDQVMSKGDLRIRSARLGPRIGSDHLAVLVEFSLVPRSAVPAERQTSTATFHQVAEWRG